MASIAPNEPAAEGMWVGKTLVAAEAAIIAIENGYQVALLAPTEILGDAALSSFKKPAHEARLCAAATHRLEHGARED